MSTEFVDKIIPKVTNHRTAEVFDVNQVVRYKTQKYPEYSDDDAFLHDILFGTNRMKEEAQNRKDGFHLK